MICSLYGHIMRCDKDKQYATPLEEKRYQGQRLWLCTPSDATDEVEKTGTAAPCRTPRKRRAGTPNSSPAAVMAMVGRETDIAYLHGALGTPRRLTAYLLSSENLGDVQ